MKNLNLIKRLWTDSHEKQSPQRFGRYAVMLIMLLTLGVGQMWADYYFQHWDANNETHLVDRGSNVHSSYFILNGSISFKISDGTWADASTFGRKASTNISLNSEYTCNKPGSDFSLSFSNRAYLVRINTSTKKLLISTFVPDAAAPSAVVSGTNVMFYIKGHEGLNYLVNSSKSQASTTTPMNYMGYSYVNTAQTNLSTYDRISNNPSGWNGDENTNIKSAAGGELFDKDKSYDIAAKTASTTASVSSETLSISTTTNATTGVYGSLPLYIQYYIDGTFVGVTYSAATASYASIAATGSNQTSTYNCSSLTNGSHTLKTVLTDGIIYWVADQDNFTVAHTYDVKLHDDNGDAHSGSATVTYGDAALTVSSHASRDGWNLTGYWTASGSGGSQVADAAGNLIANVSDWTDSNGKWIKSDDATIYAHWNQINSLSVVAGTHVTTVTGSTSPVTLNSSYAINATAFDTGWEFYNWTASPAANGTFANASSASTNVTVKNGSVTVTANAREKMTTVTVNVSPSGAGTLTLDASAFTPGNTTTAGVATSHTVVATALNSDYTFNNWSVTSNATGTASTNTYTLKGNGSAGTGTLTANFNLVACNLLYGSSTPLNSPTDGGAMSYDNTEQAYYKDVTTNSSPYYFRFSHSDEKQYAGDWNSYPDVKEAVANGDKIDCDQTVQGWENKASIKYTGASGNTIRIWFDYANKKAWITEQTYSVTINNGDHGTVSPNGVRSVGASGLTITATPAEGYKFASWSVTDGAHVASSTSATTTLTATADGTVTAIYETESPIRLYYSNPAGWSNVYAYLWDVDNTSDKNANWPGTDITTNIELVDCQQYYYYEFYPSAHAGWDRIIFNGGDGTKQTGDITFSAASNAGQYNNAGKDATGSWQNPTNPWYFAYDGDSWSTTAHPLTCTSVTSGYVELDLAANTDYAFKFVENGSTWYGCTTTTKITYENKATAQTMNNTDGGSADQTIKTAVAGTYRFTWDITNKRVTVTYPDSYKITFGMGTGGATISASGSTTGSITSGQYVAPGEDVTFTQTNSTGYTFAGWYDAESGGSAISSMASDDVYDNIAGNIEVYAQYTPNEYEITFDATTNGGALSGTSPQDVVFDETSVASCPTANKAGYCFDGWYTAATSGKKVINPNGSFVANVTDWTDEDGKWKVADEATVYAVFVAPETLIEQPARIAGKRVPIDTLDAKNHPEIDSVIVHQLFSCTPAANYNISYKLCYSNHVQLDVQPTIHYGTGAGVGYDTVWMPMDEIQMYELVAYLRTGSTRGAGDLVTTDTALVSVEKTWPVKVRYIMDGVDLREATEWPVYPSIRTTEVRIPKENSGYELDHLEYGVGVTSDSAKYINEGATYATYVKAANAATIIAHYKVPANTIYVKRLDANGWYFTSFYVYEYGPDGYWTTGKGSGSNGVAAATQSEHVYRVDDVSMHGISGSKSKMSLTDYQMDNTENFETFSYDPGSGAYNATPHVIYRTDYNAALPMFVPVAKDYQDSYILNENGDKSKKALYFRGFWMRYSPDPDSTGYFLHVYDRKEVVGAKLIQSIPMRLTKTGADGTLELTATMDLEGGKTYGFKYTKATGASTVDWYGESGTMTSTNHTDWLFTTSTNNCGLTTTSAGDYTFHLHCVNYGTKAANTASATDVQGKMVMTVDYATLDGDFRVVYQDNSQLDLTDGVGVEPIASQSMRARANGQDTVTFYIRKDATNRSMKFQKFDDGAWVDVVSGTIPLTNTTGQPFTVTKDTTYQIYVQQNADGTDISATGMDYYSGSYYIRTDCVDEHKWDYKQSLEAHRMVESDYATHLTTDPFTHYYVSWVGANGNVKYVVATQYSPTLTDTLITDAYANVAGGNLPAKGANVRFMYNKKTNTIKRAYLAGAQGGEWFANFLKLSESNAPTGYMQNTDGDAITSITFTDLGNFAYQASIKAKPGLTGKLTAEYNSQTQYFKGSAESSETILGGTGESWQNIIMTYDFKTNRLICAWTPGDTIDETMSINADVMIIRRGKNDAEQIVFKTNGTELQDVKYIYGVIQLDYNDLVGRMYSWDWWAYEHCMYYISFPFDVLVSDITGVGTIGQDWRIQRYNGALRAEKGWFEQDGVKTWWEDVHAGDTLHAYEGYSLLLARTRFNDRDNAIWKNKTYGDKVYLFFPSLNATTGIISNGEVTFTVPAHECNIERPFLNPYGEYVSHRISDSHWNMLGMPLFENKTAFYIADGPTYDMEYGSSKTLQYLYAWNSAGNTLGIQLTLDKTWEFKTMYSYMVQYTGEVTFKGSTVNKIVAAKREEEQKNYYVNLEISKDEQFIGRTYIELRENAVDSFLLNEDVYMVQNGVNADIYTVAGGCAAAANVLPIANQIVPVGLSVKQAGTYVFSMPSDFDGEVILVDKYAQTRTNLAMEDYETALPTGEITDRFEVEININKVATAIDGTNGDGSLKDGNAHKFIENGMMYILQNGALYDAQGKRVK